MFRGGREWYIFEELSDVFFDCWDIRVGIVCINRINVFE